MSHRVMAILSQLKPRLELYSIDEAFCDLAGVPAAQVESLDNPVAKRGKSPHPPDGRRRYRSDQNAGQTGQLRRQDLAQDRRIARRLATMGITTALQLADMPTAAARRQFSVVLERTVRELNGIVCLGLEEFAAPKEQIVCSRSFGDKPTELDSVSQAACAHAAQKLRGERQFCRHISVFVATSPFAASESYYGNQATTRLATPTQNNSDIIQAARQALEGIFIAGHRNHRCGVMLSDFTSERVTQFGLFDDALPRKNSDWLMSCSTASIRTVGRRSGLPDRVFPIGPTAGR